MNSIKSALTPDLAKSVLSKSPVFKKRTALWYFKQEVYREKLKQETGQEQEQSEKTSEEVKKCLSRPKGMGIWKCWKEMDPEAKRKYFNMAEEDGVRFKEQQALWMAKIGSILMGQESDIKELPNVAEQDRLASEGSGDQQSLEFLRYKRNCDRMIQTKSTQEIYKDIIAKMNKLQINLKKKDELTSTIPDLFKPILTRPRRPPTPSILFACDEKERLTQLRKERYPQMTFLALACREWLNLSQERRKHYENIYTKLLEDYHKAMEQFKKDNVGATGDYLEQASREKRAFNRSLRKKLRQSALVPLNARNAFNFFVMDNKGSVGDLVDTWRLLPEEEKEKYRQMTKEDMIRYHNEKVAYDNMMKSLLEQHDNKKETKD